MVSKRYWADEDKYWEKRKEIEKIKNKEKVRKIRKKKKLKKEVIINKPSPYWIARHNEK